MNYLIFLFILLSSVGFFNPLGILSESMQKLVFYIAFIIGIGYGLFFGKNTSSTKYPRTTYIILLCGILFSCFMASGFHQQSIKTSFVTTFSYLASYLCFFVFLKLNVPREKVMKTLIILSFISAFVYSINLIGAPFFSFGRPVEEKDLSRGIVRIAIVYIELFPLLLFYSIAKWKETKKLKWALYGSFTMLMIFLSVTRQIIFLSAILGLLYILQNTSFKSKIVIISATVLVGLIVLPRIPAYRTMLELSKEQKEKNDDKDNIRITAWEYYTYENQTNAITPIFGNGVPAFDKSPWGIAFNAETDSNLCFAADVGWAGFFYYFGAISTLALLIIFIRSTIVSKSKDLYYAAYWTILVAMTSVASGIILYYYQVVAVSLVFYLIYSEEKNKIMESETPMVLNVKPSFGGYQQL